ncbi:hypothetical protein ACHAXA_001560 [Cyclostephanos tholiformis]|uniref:Uncharacterized protein n=1 Tax=Cyclostephanos tholiformis TaxID=382380 RepID=A0ABD3RTP1_9STRA
MEGGGHRGWGGGREEGSTLPWGCVATGIAWTSEGDGGEGGGHDTLISYATTTTMTSGDAIITPRQEGIRRAQLAQGRAGDSISPSSTGVRSLRQKKKFNTKSCHLVWISGYSKYRRWAFRGVKGDGIFPSKVSSGRNDGAGASSSVVIVDVVEIAFVGPDPRSLPPPSSDRGVDQQRQRQPGRRLRREERRISQVQVPRRRFSVYGFGEQWTGALSRGPGGLYVEEAPELSYEEIRRFGVTQGMVALDYNGGGGGSDGDGDGDRGGYKCVAASAGWGHTAIIVEGRREKEGGATTAVADGRKLLVCGRPHDFQTLMRLRRLPTSLRNFCVRHSSPSSPSSSSSSPSVVQRVASYLAGENEITFHEDERRKFSNVPSLLEVELPNGEVPAHEGESFYDYESARESHAPPPGSSSSSSSSSSCYSRFQNTLATSAGLTAVISTSGVCGVGYFSPNVWIPCRVAGLASTRFVLDNVDDGLIGDDMFRKFGRQQHPIVSVSLGLQHGVALDSEGQVFCWGKGERGQLGQGRKTVKEERRERQNDGDDWVGGDDSIESEGASAPTENRTFEYALPVTNFHDPYATQSESRSDVYVPIMSKDDSKVKLVSAGMNFTMAVTRSNLPYIWGKNVRLNPSYSASSVNLRSKPVLDSTYPRYIPGLPEDLVIERIACGSHHAAMLLEDGSIWVVGVATDKPAPLWDEAVEVLASGVVDVTKLISFTAGFDRTIVVSGSDDGRRQVIEVQLWSNEELRQHGAVRPSWVDWLESEKREEKVCSIHRGWMHSIVRTE